MFLNSKWIASSHDCESAGNDKRRDGSTLMRYKFDINDDIETAALSICGLGIGVYWVNGESISNDVLATPFTMYDKRVLYSEYDISKYVSKGNNVLAIHLGNGRYNHYGSPLSHYRKVIFEIKCVFKSGKTITFNSDTSIKTFEGPAIFNHAKSGEIYDARLEPEGWNALGFDDSLWNYSVVCCSPGDKIEKNNCPPIRITRDMPMTKISDNRYTTVQNISGWVKIKVKGNCGDRVSIKYGEQIDNDGKLNERINIFCPYEQKHCDEFILKGNGIEEYEPSFVYHGFRYADIITDAQIIEVVGRVVHNDVQSIASFECSEDVLNKIHKMCKWTTLTNLHWIPTDCPHREQEGWTVDAMNASEQAMISFDMLEIYRKWMQDIVDTQRTNGQISCICPGAKYDWGIGVNWDSALILVPYFLYKIYGDVSVVAQTWDSMELLMSFFESKSDNYIIGYGIGDWLAPPNTAGCSIQSMETALYYFDATVMARLAELLGKDPSDYLMLSEKIKASFINKFLNNEESNKSQTVLAIGIYTGVYGEYCVDKAKQLSELVINNGYHIDCGIVGSKFIFSALSNYGYSDVIYKMVTEPTMPSYAYWVSIGMTTLCENWNLVNPDDGFMASNNHPAHSEVNAWLYEYLAGIRFEGGEVYIQPCFVRGMDYVKAKYKDVSVYWDKSTLRIDVPNKTLVIVDGEKMYFDKGKHEIKL